jgi:hypothetical protein
MFADPRYYGVMPQKRSVPFFWGGGGGELARGVAGSHSLLTVAVEGTTASPAGAREVIASAPPPALAGGGRGHSRA